MPQNTILVVDDEKDLRDLIAIQLEKEGYYVKKAKDGLVAMKKAMRSKPDLIVLDIMMPNMDGYAVCKELKNDVRTADVPILFLSAKSDPNERVLGFESGADDYLDKPFSMKELSLRVSAILKRATKEAKPALIEIGGFSLDKSQLKLYLEGEEIELTSTEFKLLLALSESPGTTLEREFLLNKVWGYNENVQTRTLDTHMKRLRKKLGSESPRVETIRGIGYRFNE